MDDLYPLLDASEATVRRDLEWLEHTGLLKGHMGSNSQPKVDPGAGIFTEGTKASRRKAVDRGIGGLAHRR